MIAKVSLDWPELAVAALVGVARRITGLFDLSNAFMSANTSDFNTDIMGAAAEMVTSKYLGDYWAFHVRHKGADLPGGRHVRSTKYWDGQLIVRKRDKQHGRNAVMVLVITEAPHFHIVGWMRLHEAIKPEFFEEGKIGKRGKKQEDAWWVPQEFLHQEAIPRDDERDLNHRETGGPPLPGLRDAVRDAGKLDERPGIPIQPQGAAEQLVLPGWSFDRVHRRHRIGPGDPGAGPAQAG